MSLISIVLAIAVVGFVAWILMQIPMPQVFKNIMLGVLAFALVIWLLQSFGLIGGPVLRLK